jgi:protein XagA
MKKILFLILILPNFAWAGDGWNPKKKKGFIKWEQRIIMADQYFNLDGNIVPITTTGIHITSLYAEYGLTDRIAATIYSPIFFRSTLNGIQYRQSNRKVPGDSYHGIGDTNVGLLFGIIQNQSYVVNLGITLGLPIGETMGGDTQLLQTGDGEFNQLLKINVGHSFSPAPFYASAGIGFNNRTKGFSDEWHVSGEFGWSISSKLILAMKAYSVQSLMNGDSFVSTNTVFSNNTEFLMFGPEIFWQAKGKFGVTGGASFAASGRNILAAPSFSLGVFAKW